MQKDVKQRNTKQKQIVIDFLKENMNVHLMPEQIIENLKNENRKVSQATVYRILNALTDEGIIRKYFINDSQCSCYQYIKDKDVCKSHYHLICSECGKVLHFENKKIAGIRDEILKEEEFSIDLKRVVFYGICSSCNTSEVK